MLRFSQGKSRDLKARLRGADADNAGGLGGWASGLVAGESEERHHSAAMGSADAEKWKIE